MTDTVEQGSEKTYDIDTHQMDNREHIDENENAAGGVDMPVEGAVDDADDESESDDETVVGDDTSVAETAAGDPNVSSDSGEPLDEENADGAA